MKAAKIFSLLLCILTAGAYLPSSAFADSEAEFHGWMLFHSYSDYGALDSTVKLYDLRKNEITIIDSPDYVNEMNADFGSHPYDIVFMAIDQTADEWDIIRYNAVTGSFTNLTENSGYRNEDPKFSPDGRKIVFKRGYWSHEQNDFVYDLAEMELHTGEITMLTDDVPEQAMPYYSADGSYVYYSIHMKNGETGIYRLSLNDAAHAQECMYSDEGIFSYYPVVSENRILFTKWFSADNHNDSIAELIDGIPYTLPFCNENFNYSDSFPMENGHTIYSGTQNGSYDLYYYDGETSYPFHKANTELNELGAAYYSDSDALKLLKNTQSFIVSGENSECNMDADGNDMVNIFDLILFKRLFS